MVQAVAREVIDMSSKWYPGTFHEWPDVFQRDFDAKGSSFSHEGKKAFQGRHRGRNVFKGVKGSDKVVRRGSHGIFCGREVQHFGVSLLWIQVEDADL